MYRLKRLSLAVMLIAALGLVGCGGGGGSTVEEPPPPMPTAEEACTNAGGQFADGVCTSAEELALAAALAPYQARAKAAADATRAAADSAAAAVAAISSGDPENKNLQAAMNAAADADRRARQAAAEYQNSLDAENVGDAAEAATSAEFRQAQAESRLEQVASYVEKFHADVAKANAALGKLMHAALGPPDAADTTAIDNAAVSLSSAGLAVDLGTGAGALPTADGDPDSVTLAAGDSVGSLSGWAGTAFSLSTGTGNAKVTHEAVVYTNRGAPKTEDFGEVHTLTDGSLSVEAANIGLVMADAFTHSGTQTHQPADRIDAVYIRGTYDGAPGEYSCPTGCSSTNDGKGSPTSLAGTWTFTPDAGAMVSQPDADYLFFGWWVRKNSKGEPVAAGAFAEEVGDADGTDNTSSGADLTGSATYIGKAAGKFAMSNTLDGTGNAGHFTADAELIAKFGAIAADNANGVTGTIDNFRLNDGSDDPGWSVSLNRSSAWEVDGAITGPTSDATVWSINGNKAAASGAWSGTMYDEKPGDPPTGDGSNIPTTVTGTFYSEFSNIGRMVGAFGTNLDQ